VGIDHATAYDGFAKAYEGVDRFASSLSRQDLLATTRCRGWVVADVLNHVLADAQRALIALASPVPGPAGVDFAGYWRAFADAGADDAIGHIWSVRRSAASFRDGVGNVVLWRETSPAAVRAASLADPAGFVTTQGHVLAVPDFLVTLATEAVIHHLDMTVDIPDAPAPHVDALALAATTLNRLAGAMTRPTEWQLEEYVLKATGRVSLTAEEQAAGHAYPLLS
jgi:hypothetical protein